VAICVDEMPAVRAYATSRILRPIMAMRCSRSYNMGGVGRRVEYRLYAGRLSGREKQIGRVGNLEGADGGHIRVDW
jgi:hypothetical protein